MSETYTQSQAALAAGGFYVIGVCGDDDPQHALESIVFTNGGDEDLHLGHSLTDILAGRVTIVATGITIPIEGPCENLIVYNPHASTTGAWSINATCKQRNSGRDGGMLAARSTPASANRYTVIRPNRAAGAVTVTALPVRYSRLVKSVTAYSVAKASGGTITVNLLDSQGRSLLASPMDAEALTNKTLYTAATLSTTTPLRVARPLSIVYSSSAGGDALGDILIEIAHEVA